MIKKCHWSLYITNTNYVTLKYIQFRCRNNFLNKEMWMFTGLLSILSMPASEIHCLHRPKWPVNVQLCALLPSCFLHFVQSFLQTFCHCQYARSISPSIFLMQGNNKWSTSQKLPLHTVRSGVFFHSSESSTCFLTAACKSPEPFFSPITKAKLPPRFCPLKYLDAKGRSKYIQADL